jgi:hypothetical protein
VHTGNKAPRDGKQWTTSLSEVSATAGGTGCIWALGGDNTDKDNNDMFLSIAVMWLSWSSSHRLMSSILTRMRSSYLVKVVVVVGSTTPVMMAMHHADSG